jgi:hypothetical protein
VIARVLAYLKRMKVIAKVCARKKEALILGDATTGKLDYDKFGGI